MARARGCTRRGGHRLPIAASLLVLAMIIATARAQDCPVSCDYRKLEDPKQPVRRRMGLASPMFQGAKLDVSTIN